MREVATKNGLPLIFLGESTRRAHTSTAWAPRGRAIPGPGPVRVPPPARNPWVSALLGPCYGSSTWYACLSDFVVMRRGATMAVASGRVRQGHPPGNRLEELGGWRMHYAVDRPGRRAGGNRRRSAGDRQEVAGLFPQQPERAAVAQGRHRRKACPTPGRSCSTCRPTATRSMTCARRSTASSTATA